MENQSDKQQHILWARKRFIAMALTYFLGVFNDNFFKQAVLLLAVALGMNHIQGYATELFSLPFILFSAWGGWLADRFAKKQVVIGVKFLELAAMLIGAYGIITLNWNCVLAMVFLMGLQSTLFGPALNGSIPELYPREYVTKANALLKLVTTVAILLGMALAGFALDQHWFTTTIPFGRMLVAITVVLVALCGVVSSLGVYSRPASGRQVRFPWTGPINSFRDLLLLKNDPLLLLAVICDSFFYFISLLAVLVINTLGIQQLGLDSSQTSILSVSLMVGVCIGSLVAAQITSQEQWTHVLMPGAVGMGASLAAAGFLAGSGNGQFLLLLVALLCAGSFGGLFLIPVTSFIQVRPDAGMKGRIIAVANFTAFTCMFFAGRIFPLLDSTLLPSAAMVLLGAVAVAAGGVLWLSIRKLNNATNHA
jgi:MFS family permease